jgi:hypothetical protein
MKTWIKIAVVLSIALVSCKERTPDMLTRINADGSCYREFTRQVSLDNLSGKVKIKENLFPVAIDSTWKLFLKAGDLTIATHYPLKKCIVDSIERALPKTDTVAGRPSHDVTMLIHKEFRSVEKMATDFKYDTTFAWNTMKIRYSLTKKFRWFYTYYTYRETYPKIKLNLTIPIDKYMSNDEAGFWFTGKPDLLQGMNGIEIREYMGRLEDKYNEWFVYNIWVQEFAVLVDNYDKIAKVPVSKQRLEQLRDTIFEAKVKGKDDVKMKDILKDYFKTDAFSALWSSENGPMNKFEERFGRENHLDYFLESLKYRLIMPGKVTRTNSLVAEGDTLSWNITAYRMVPDDYTIEATSAKANIWAFIVTGLVVLIAIGSFVWKPRKK